jgi:hypothetical protein
MDAHEDEPATARESAASRASSFPLRMNHLNNSGEKERAAAAACKWICLQLLPAGLVLRVRQSDESPPPQ